ncbi:MAG: TonB-dependent receptor [Porticoccaceae bacterium]|nr:TonB-dependent receptor [Porticoccaceae bacterium]
MQKQRSNKPLRKAVLASLIPAIGLTSTALYAQPALEEIIVTAQKRAQDLQDVAIAVTAIQGDELTNAGIDSQRALSMMTPNVVVNVNADYVAPYIRGVGTQYANPGLEPSVGTYFNDVYISRASGGFMSFSDVERMEVLKGPQGTLYGRNTTGGAIRIITKDPTDYFEAGVGVTAGNYKQRGSDFYISGPLMENLNGRLSGQIEQRDGYVDHVAGGRDMADRDQFILHSKLDWAATDRLNVKLDMDWFEKDDAESTAFQALFPGLPEQVGGAFGGAIQDDHHEITDNVYYPNKYTAGGGQLRFDYEFDSFHFSAVSGYRYNKFVGHADLDGTSAPLFDSKTVLSKTESYSQEFQVVSTTDSRLQWQAGVYYYFEKSRHDFGMAGAFIDADLGFPGSFVGGDGRVDITSLAPYGQITYDITDEWELMLGLRYTDEEKKAKNDFYVTTVGSRITPNRPNIMTEHVPEEKLSFTELNPKVMLSWRPSSDIMLYASYSEGFKSGGFNLPQPAPGAITQVEQELITSYELGWKTEFNRLRFNGAIFYYELEDLQLQVTDASGGITSIRNAGDADVKGAEFDLVYAATENLMLGAGAGWQETKFGDVANGQYFVPCAQIPEYLAKGMTLAAPTCENLGGLGMQEFVGNLRGNDLPHAPKLTGYLRATYTQSLTNMGSSLTYSLLVNYSDKYYYTSDNLYEEPSKTMVNANITWMSPAEKYQISVFGTNLTDKDHNTHKAPFAGSGGWKVPGPPRLLGARFAVNF